MYFTEFSEEEVIAQSLNFLAAGYETTSTTLCYASRFLALNACHQKKLIEEIDSVFGGKVDIEYDKLIKMQYLDCFVKEIMRLFCAVNRFAFNL